MGYAYDCMGNPQKFHNLGHMLEYKRLRVFGAAAVLSYILMLFSQNYTNFSFDRLPRPSTFKTSSSPTNHTDWSRFAYTQYVTKKEYLCNSVMIFENLHRIESKADRVMMYPATMQLDPSSTTDESRLLLKARDEYNVKLIPIEIQRKGLSAWSDSYTKLLAFNLTQYKRVMSLDSDAVVLQSMDELFLLPPASVAMPRAYWLGPTIFTSALLLIQPSSEEFARMQDAIKTAGDGEYDMEILNDLYDQSCMVLPHRPYIMLSAEFRDSGYHENYLGNISEIWDPETIFREAKYVHFSDWPMPKPWLRPMPEVLDNTQPTCYIAYDGEEDCRARDIWLGFYSDFETRRKDVCGMEVLANSITLDDILASISPTESRP